MMDVGAFAGHSRCETEAGVTVPDGAGAVRPLVDPFGRTISYLRLSVTDRCDLRCRYCMPARPDFLPKREVLTIEELCAVARTFIARGVKKVRITGGEPLVRKGLMTLVRRLGSELGHGLEELTLTTNGQLLAAHAEGLHEAGMRRINVSLDTLKAARYREITRRGDLAPVIEGLAEARRVGLAVKLNVVAMRGINEDEIDDLVIFAGEQGFDLTLIETMPLGAPEGDARAVRFLPLDVVRRRLEERWTIVDLPDHATGGPARYVRIVETGGRVGFISPLSRNFCAGCNRVRVSATGRLYLCLGGQGGFDLKRLLRDQGAPALARALDRFLLAKPAGHAFEQDMASRRPTITRHMNVTGG